MTEQIQLGEWVDSGEITMEEAMSKQYPPI
jgi:hypothetical protein